MTLTEDLHWSEYRQHNVDTLKRLDEVGLLKLPREDITILVEQWSYPMYTLDMSRKEVDRRKLQARQDAWVAQEQLGGF